MFDHTSFFHGLVLGLGMFVCPGPKDVLILRHALLQRSAWVLITVGVFSDAVLIGIGMAGASAALAGAPAWQSAALWLGVCLLLVHGCVAAKHAVRGSSDALTMAPVDPAPRQGLAALLTVSFLNPVAWLDTLLVIGAVGAATPAQGSFALGAVLASLTWFVVLVVGARTAGRWVTHRNAGRALDSFVALTMTGMAAYVASGLL
jgi:L-lysine exporter family protein LysE/ArgO